MIFTGNFAMLRKLNVVVFPVSIAASKPFWYKGLEYKKLAPPMSLVNDYKRGRISWDTYTTIYNEQLDKLSHTDVMDDLFRLVRPSLIKMVGEPTLHEYLKGNPSLDQNPDILIALLCYEKSDQPCHRQLVRQWFHDGGYNCMEIKV